MPKLNGTHVTWILRALVVLGASGAFGICFAAANNNHAKIEKLEEKTAEGLAGILAAIHAHELRFGHIGMNTRVESLQSDVTELKEGQVRIERKLDNR